MALPSRTYQAAVIQSHNGKNMANVLCLTRGGAAVAESLVAQAVADAWTQTNSFVDCQVQDIGYVEIRVRNLSDGLAEVVVPWIDTGDAATGNVVGDPVDPGSCLLYTLRTGLAGKSNRGRLYLGGVGRGALDAFSTAWDLSTSPGSTFANSAATFQSQLGGGTTSFDWCVHSRKNATANIITSIVARTSVTSQNPRARRYGVV